MGGLSKVYALPGLRIGWLVTRDRALCESLAAFKDYTTICSSAPSEVLAVMALRAAGRILKRNRGIINANLAALEAFMARWPTRFEWLSPQGGTIAFPRLLGPTPVNAFCKRLLSERGVLLLPGEVFDFPDNHFRIGYGRRNMPEALDGLGTYLAANPV